MINCHQLCQLCFDTDLNAFVTHIDGRGPRPATDVLVQISQSLDKLVESFSFSTSTWMLTESFSGDAKRFDFSDFLGRL